MTRVNLSNELSNTVVVANSALAAAGQSSDEDRPGSHFGIFYPLTQLSPQQGEGARPNYFLADPNSPPTSRGFSLVELLIVVSIMGIFAGIVLTGFDPAIQDQLRGAAQIVAADIAYARDLAVSGSSTYKISFNTDSDLYVLEHSGTNPALDTLPDSPFRDPSDPADKQTTDLWNLGAGSGSIELFAVYDLTPSRETASDLEFGPLGESTRSYETQIWLAAGQDAARRYISVSINPVTGLTSLSELQATAPTLPSDPDAGIAEIEDSGESEPLLKAL